MTPDTQTPTPSGWRRFTVGQLLVLLGGVLALAAAVVSQLDAGAQSHRADTAETKAVQVGEQRDDVVTAADRALNCDGKAQVDPAASLACAEIQDAKNDPVPVPESVDYDAVQRYVDDALDADPRLSEASLLARLQEVLAANPPEDGKTPTDAELLVLIRQVYAENPPPTPQDGAPGQNAYCFDNPDDPACQPREGKPGVDGAPGQPPFGWVTQYPDGSREECERPEGFDPQQPRYRCVFYPAPEPPPTQTTDPEPPGGGLLPGG
jgi:hypothetical protein